MPLSLVEFPLKDGGSVLIETDERALAPDASPSGRPATRGLRPAAPAPTEIIPAAHSLESALEAVRPVLESVTRLIHEIAPDDWEVTFGIKLNAQAGAFIARAGLEGNFQIRMTWKASDREL